jgi:hypothetical protein
MGFECILSSVTLASWLRILIIPVASGLVSCQTPFKILNKRQPKQVSSEVGEPIGFPPGGQKPPSGTPSDQSDQRPEQGGFSEFIGTATHFGAVAPDGGGCGTPPELMLEESKGRFVALNVQDTPGDYRNDPTGRKPRPNSTGHGLGMFQNGRNCGRWIKVTLDDVCSGMSDGTAGKPLCQNGQYQPDPWNGASQYFLVSDSCQDDNAWCRDDRYHVDLATAGLQTFVKDGRTISFTEWKNRKVRWSFVKAPDYKGDLRIVFVKDSFISLTGGSWVAIVVTHLPNGLSRVEAKNVGSRNDFVPLRMVSDNGQKFEGLPAESDEWLLRFYDYDGSLISIDQKPYYRIKFPCGASRCPRLFQEPKGGILKQAAE